MDSRAETDPVVHCPECRAAFRASEGCTLFYGERRVEVHYCSSDCLLDGRERLAGRSPRARWPTLRGLLWRGKRVLGW